MGARLTIAAITPPASEGARCLSHHRAGVAPRVAGAVIWSSIPWPLARRRRPGRRRHARSRLPRAVARRPRPARHVRPRHHHL